MGERRRARQRYELAADHGSRRHQPGEAQWTGPVDVALFRHAGQLPLGVPGRRQDVAARRWRGGLRRGGAARRPARRTHHGGIRRDRGQLGGAVLGRKLSQPAPRPGRRPERAAARPPADETGVLSRANGGRDEDQLGAPPHRRAAERNLRFDERRRQLAQALQSQLFVGGRGAADEPEAPGAHAGGRRERGPRRHRRHPPRPSDGLGDGVPRNRRHRTRPVVESLRRSRGHDRRQRRRPSSLPAGVSGSARRSGIRMPCSASTRTTGSS